MPYSLMRVLALKGEKSILQFFAMRLAESFR